jgi:hypothetical protein
LFLKVKATGYRDLTPNHFVDKTIAVIAALGAGRYGVRQTNRLPRKIASMNLKKTLVKSAFFIHLAALPLFAGAAVTSQVVTTTAHHSQTSSIGQQVALWLQQHTARVNGRPVGDFDQIGDLTVTHSHQAASDGRARPQAPGDGPPTDLPLNAKPGDTFLVTSCSKGVSQTWSFVFVNNPSGGSWQLVEYKYNQKNCSAGGT